MPLGFGCVHPEGEGDDYDGLYYKQNELQSLSEELVGKPLYNEHVPESVGEVTHAWVGSQTAGPELNRIEDALGLI